MFRIAFTRQALDHLDQMRKYDSRKILDAIEKQLSDLPAQETRNRKPLRPNKLAEWEMRVGDFRVFYDVLTDDGLVKIEAVGYKKGTKLFIAGEEYEL